MCFINTDMTAKKIPKNDREKWVWIKAMLELKHSSLSILARDLKMARQSVQQVRFKTSRRVEKAIAEKLGYTPEQIWPERYPVVKQRIENNHTNGRRI